MIATWLFGADHPAGAIAIHIAICAVITLVATALMSDYTGKDDISGEYITRISGLIRACGLRRSRSERVLIRWEITMMRAMRSLKADQWLIRSLLMAATIAAVLSLDSRGFAQIASPSPAGSENAAPTPDNAILLTIFLKHDQSRPLSELNAQLEKQGFYKAFPPAGVEVVSWYVMMGVGQVVTLRFAASRLREVNRIFETTAWGAYRTEFYPTYDYKQIGIANHDKAQAK